jgi:uncharacterized membrane protein
MLLAALNVIMGLVCLWLQLHQIRKHKHEWNIFKLMSGIVAGYFAIVYTIVLVYNPDMNTFGTLWIRPGVTVLLAVMAAGAIYRARSGNDNI